MSRASHDANGRAHLPRVIAGGSITSLGAGAVVSVGLGLALGLPAAGSALGAAIVVTVTFVLGVLGLTFILAGPGARPELAMMGAFVVYAAQLITLTALALALHGAPWVDNTGVAVGGIAAVLGWMAGHVHGFTTARIPVFHPVKGNVS